MFKNKVKEVKTESTEDFLARGGEITKIAEGDSYKRKTRKPLKIDAQKLIDNTRNEYEEQQVYEFLKSQGIEVE